MVVTSSLRPTALSKRSENRPPIIVDGLRKSFRHVTALDGVDFQVDPGTVLGLLGPNGAGKTTAVRVLTTLLPADGGYVEVAGFDITRDPGCVRAALGLAGQNVAVDGHLTGMENLILVGRLRQLPRLEARKQAGNLLERFDLTYAANRTARTYSGGMRRRLDLAASLVGQPPILFLDEPTTGLDPRSRLELWDVIEGLVAEGTTLLLTTQYLEEADRLANSIAVVDKGRVIAHGTPLELKSAVGGERLEVSLSNPVDFETARGILASFDTTEATTDPTSRTISVPAPRGFPTLVEAIRRFDEARVEPEDISLRRPALDDVFLALTGHTAESVDTGDGQTGEQADTAGASRNSSTKRTQAARREPFSRNTTQSPPKTSPDAPNDLLDDTIGATERASTPNKPKLLRRIVGTASDTEVIMWRNLLRYVRLPNLLVITTIEPVMFVLMFDFVFGGVIKLVVHGSYIDYLMPGIFMQAVVFNSTQTGIGLAEDLSGGMVDRFRSLPMARIAVLTGRTMADAVRNVFVVLLMTGVGLLVGFRITHGLVPVVVVVAMAVAFGTAFSWISAVIGLLARDVEAAQAAGFVWILPITFASSAFVPIPSMPGWLQAFSKADPVSISVGAMRALLTGGPAATQIYESIGWVVAILAVCVPLTLALYRRLT